MSEPTAGKRGEMSTTRRKRKTIMRAKRQETCLILENQCVSVYKRNPDATPDGSFMRYAFIKGYEAALRDQRPR